MKNPLFTSRYLALGAAFAALALSSSSANAALPTFKFLSLGSEGQNVNITVNSVSQNTYAGRYNGSLETAANSNTFDAFKMFCVDAPHTIGVPDSYSTLVSLGLVTDAGGSLNLEAGKYFYTDDFGGGAGLVSALTTTDYKPVAGFLTNAERAQAAAYIIDTYLAMPALTSDQAAGAQLAIWDIVQDGGDGQGTGGFLSNAGGSLLTEANSIVTTAKTKLFANNRALWIQAPRSGTGNNSASNAHKQDFAFRSSNPIPELSTLSLSGLMMVGGLGALLKRRKNA